MFDKFGLVWYGLADLKKIIAVTLDPVDGFEHVRGQFGLVFQGQSNGKIKSSVQLYKSADIKEILLLLWIQWIDFNM